MNHINVTINGRQYRMACEEGQEARLLQLAENFETRIGDLRGKFGEIGDSRLTMMAALTLADELLDSEQRIRALEEELAGSPPEIAPTLPLPVQQMPAQRPPPQPAPGSHPMAGKPSAPSAFAEKLKEAWRKES